MMYVGESGVRVLRGLLSTVNHPPTEKTQRATDIRPEYYGGAENPYEVFKVIDAWELDFYGGNAVKYIARAGKKTPDPRQDLKKAITYLNAWIERSGG